MDKTKKKKVQMPSGIRSKLTAAVAMLLISSLLVVGSTYAWFTLSTAPEVSGITTSVGANGNLEIALLKADGSLDISSAVGDSSAVKGVTAANITWGNLVDLDDPSYGLQSINLLPSRLNITGGNVPYGVSGLLQIPVYGADGRIASLSNETYSSASYAVGTKTWAFSNTLSYGVRAIGANDNLTKQEAGIIAAKAAYNSNMNSAKAIIQNALSANGSNLASAVTTLAMDANVTLEDNQEQAVTAMVTASGSALDKIDAAYKQVLVALAASTIAEETTYTAAANAINSAANYEAAITALTTAGATVTVPGYLTTAVGALATQKSAVTTATTKLGEDDYKAALNALVDTTKVTVNGFEVNDSDSDPSNDLMVDADNLNPDVMNKIITDGGAIVEMPGKFVVNGESNTVFEGSGVFAYIGSVAGNYSAGCKVTIDYKGMKLSNMPATMKTTATADTTVSSPLTSLTAIAATGVTTTTLSDTYGYALDFAFRTNAPGNKLQLQTAAAQRVYSDSTSTATQGAGSSMTFKSADGANMTDDDVKNLMGAIRVAFINPDNGKVYAIAAIDSTNITNTADGIKGNLVLMDYNVVGGVITNLAAKTGDTKADIMELPQNTATKLTAVVWLDGDQVDNADVANAAQSITGSMNLQFSSSAKLTPMQNTALKTMD